MALSPDKARRVLETAELVCSAQTVSNAVSRLAREISGALGDSNPLALCVMRGGVIFAGQLLPLLRFPLEVDYVDLTRYGDATRGGAIIWKVEPSVSVAGRTVLVLDDILDEGHTLAAVRERLMSAGAMRVAIAVLADKEIGRPKACSADFIGVRLPDRYVFGYGLDVGGSWRNLPEIYALTENIAENLG